MDFEWDETKNRRNIEIRGIDFLRAARVFQGPTLERADIRKDYGEARFVTVGLVDGLEITVVYTWRGSRRRIISARRAHADERAKYYEIFPDLAEPAAR